MSCPTCGCSEVCALLPACRRALIVADALNRLESFLSCDSTRSDGVITLSVAELRQAVYNHLSTMTMIDIVENTGMVSP